MSDCAFLIFFATGFVLSKPVTSNPFFEKYSENHLPIAPPAPIIAIVLAILDL